MKIFHTYFYNPFKKRNNGERILGFNYFKDWSHSNEFDLRFSLFKIPHLTICHAYTNIKKQEYIEVFISFRSKSYRKQRGGSTWYEKRKFVQGIDDGRNSSC